MAGALVSVAAGPGGFGSAMLASNDVTGATDSATQLTAYTLATTGGRTVPTASDPCGTAVIKYGPGTYYFNAPLMDPAVGPSGKIRGLRFEGAGTDLTVFVFQPSAVVAMCTNRKWQNVRFKGISFVCTTAGCDFMQSQEQAGLSTIQYFDYDDCAWSGWQNVFMLTGANNNSEWTWDRCAFGTCTGNVLYVPGNAVATITASQVNLLVPNLPEIFMLGATVSFTATLGNIIINTSYYVVVATTTTIQISATAGGSPISPTTSGTLTAAPATDQFLNFSFHNTKYDPSTSNAPFINMAKGGSIVTSGYFDVSGWAPTVDTYLFNLLGNAHAQGVLTFKLGHLRVECQSDHALLMHVQWGGGNVILDSVDMSSQVSARTNHAIAYVFVELINVAGPNLKFSNSNFLGTHQYTYYSNNYTVLNRAVYDSCDILQQPNGASFCTFTAAAGNTGGAPVVEFSNSCRGNDNSEFFPTTLNWQTSLSGFASHHVVNFVGLNSAGPTSGGNLQRKLPKNAVVRSVDIVKQANANPASAYDFTLQTIESTPTVLANIAGANAASAINYTAPPPNFWMLSDAQRTLQFVDTLGGGRSAVFNGYVVMVDYVG